MLENVTLFCHNSIKLDGSKKIYVDPYLIDKDYKDADYIFCTHGHYDHFQKMIL
jgi:L-ascorbate metabolism protein UlaG (beta-lactamase superfamily)